MFCFFREFSEFATSPSAAIGCTKKLPANRSDSVCLHSHCVESFEGLLQRCRRARGCSELWKNDFFPTPCTTSNTLRPHLRFNLFENCVSNLFASIFLLFSGKSTVWKLFLSLKNCGHTDNRKRKCPPQVHWSASDSLKCFSPLTTKKSLFGRHVKE